MTNENTFDGFSASLETENEMIVEEWMMNYNSFTSVFKIETETENPLQLENWMTGDSDFSSLAASLKTETESELVLEDWMMNEKMFNNNQIETKITKTGSQPISTATFYYREVNNEEKLVVEGWMLNADILGK
jgi:hypothetical protein